MIQSSELNITKILRLLLVLGLIAWTFFILKPFILIIIWALILAVALFPVFESWLKKFSNEKMGVISFALISIILLFTPIYFLSSEIFTNTKNVVQELKVNNLEISKPSEDVKSWPLIGEKIYTEWSQFSIDAKGYTIKHKEIIIDKGSSLLTNISGIFGTLIMFIFSFIISIVFMSKAEHNYNKGQLLFKKLFGTEAEDVLLMCRDTIRSVVKGILLVALIQTVLALIGFKLIGIPAAGFLAFLVLVAAIMQIPAILVMIPAILLAFSTADTTPAVIFTIYIIAVALSDNILKPMFLGKGLKTPMIIVLIGTIGGMLLHGIIGLFVGAVVLSVAYRLYSFWVNHNN